ncbi:MAG: hypothetical protein ACR2NL_08960 [Acidimicrobiia bacterium]
MAYESEIHITQSFGPRNTSRRYEWLSASTTCVRTGLAELGTEAIGLDIKLAAPGGITI